MAKIQQQGKVISFKSFQLFKDQTLGIGSYGKVCKAKCDDLLCAAKLIHETLFDPTAQQLITPQREHRLPLRRFEQECEFLSTIRHPNIVQYLGIYRDPDTGLPALLMELMDDSLAHFIETFPQPIPYFIQVNICHDITLALSFLHSNDIVHRDLSSNNVLLIGNAVRAKVTDFGMARLGDQNPRITQLTFTMCPGTDVYMPPEAVQDKPVYTEKMDCFSFGVITLQIMTREFPKPGDRRKRIEIDHPGLPKDTMIEARISEVERRQNHIDKINPNHSLLPIAFNCLHDVDVERPSAQQLCERVAVLKEDQQYNESMRADDERSTAEKDICRHNERDRELRSLRQQVQRLQQTVQSQMNQLDESAQALRHKDESIAAAEQQVRQQERERNQAIEEKVRLERQLRRVNQQLKESERNTAQFESQIAEQEQPIPSTDEMHKSKEQSSSRANIKLTWREGKKAPRGMSYQLCAAVDDSTLYVRVSRQVYAYSMSTSTWSRLPNCKTTVCPSVIVNNLLTVIGGYQDSVTSRSSTNQLFSLTGKGSGRRWPEEFPPMPTKRHGSIALCTGTALIVAGGHAQSGSMLRTVEVLNTATLQWSTAADLPQPVHDTSGAICGDYTYILAKGGRPTMYTCSTVTLIQSRKASSSTKRDTSVWKKAAVSPVILTACVTVHDRLLAIGGEGSIEKYTTAVHLYDPATDSWEVISHMTTPRCYCIAAVFPNNQLMVVGGYTVGGETNSVEFAGIDV